MKVQIVCNAPQIFLMKELLFHDECDRITQKLIPKLDRFNGNVSNIFVAKEKR